MIEPKLRETNVTGTNKEKLSKPSESLKMKASAVKVNVSPTPQEESIGPSLSELQAGLYNALCVVCNEDDLPNADQIGTQGFLWYKLQGATITVSTSLPKSFSSKGQEKATTSKTSCYCEIFDGHNNVVVLYNPVARKAGVLSHNSLNGSKLISDENLSAVQKFERVCLILQALVAQEFTE